MIWGSLVSFWQGTFSGPLFAVLLHLSSCPYCSLHNRMYYTSNTMHVINKLMYWRNVYRTFCNTECNIHRITLVMYFEITVKCYLHTFKYLFTFHIWVLLKNQLKYIKNQQIHNGQPQHCHQTPSK